MFRVLAVLLFISINAFADLKPIPLAAINCAKTAKPTDITMMMVFGSKTDGRYVEFSAMLTNANCYNKGFQFKEIAPDFNLYIDNPIYTNSDFSYTATRIGAGNADLDIKIRFLVDEYFRPGLQREALLTFYAVGSATTSFGWRLIFTQDPQTKMVQLNARPISAAKMAELQAR